MPRPATGCRRRPRKAVVRSQALSMHPGRRQLSRGRRHRRRSRREEGQPRGRAAGSAVAPARRRERIVAEQIGRAREYEKLVSASVGSSRKDAIAALGRRLDPGQPERRLADPGLARRARRRREAALGRRGTGRSPGAPLPGRVGAGSWWTRLSASCAATASEFKVPSALRRGLSSERSDARARRASGCRASGRRG